MTSTDGGGLAGGGTLVVLSAVADRFGALRRPRAQPIAGVLLGLATVAFFLPSFNDLAPEMDEGLLVAYPTFVLDGLVPGRDFETFYGPGTPYLIAGAFEVFGPSLGVERAVGLAFRLVIALSVFLLVLPAGVVLAVLGALAAVVLLLPLGLQALAIIASLAALLAGLAVLARAIPAESAPVGSAARFVLAGVLGGLALTFRPDLVPAVLLGALPLLAGGKAERGIDRPAVRYGLGLLLACIPLVVWAAIVGPDRISLLVEDLVTSRSGRRLPLPGPSEAEGQLLLVIVAVAVAAVAGGIVRLRHRRGDRRGSLMLALGITLVCLLPSVLQRADKEHILPVASLAVGVSPVVGASLLECARGAWRERGMVLALVAIGGIGVAAAFANRAQPALRDQVRSIDQSTTRLTVGDRYFRVAEPPAVDDLNVLLPRLAEVTTPGDRLFVGTQDLRRTVYADTFVYFLFPELRPASFYAELNPGTANAEGSSLAQDLRSADAVLLTTRWDWLAEQTEASGEPGPEAPNEVIDEEFCVDTRQGTYTLYVRC